MAQSSTDDRVQKTRHVTIKAQFTRPANTTQYAEGDVLSDHATTPSVMPFTGAARYDASGGIIRSVSLHKSDDDLTGAAFDLYLFDAVPTAMEDNAAFDPTDAEGRTIIGGVEFLAADGRSLGVTGSGTGNHWHKTVWIPFTCGAGTTAIWGVLVARGTYTPASAEVIAITLGIEQD